MQGDRENRNLLTAAVTIFAGATALTLLYRSLKSRHATAAVDGDEFDHATPDRLRSDGQKAATMTNSREAEMKRQQEAAAAAAEAEAEIKRQQEAAAAAAEAEAEIKRQQEAAAAAAEAEAEIKRQQEAAAAAAEAEAEIKRQQEAAAAAAEAEAEIKRQQEAAAAAAEAEADLVTGHASLVLGADASFFHKILAQLKSESLEGVARGSLRVGGLRVDTSALPSFTPLVSAPTVRHPLCVMTWRHKSFNGFEIRLQAEDLRHFRRQLTSSEYEREALEAINHVFGSTDSVQVVESCRASHAVGKCFFDRFSLLCVYTDPDPGSDGADVRVFTRVADGIGYTLTYTGLVDNQACVDEFFEAARTCTESPTFRQLLAARADAAEHVTQVRPARFHHALRVSAACDWVVVAHQPDTVRIAHAGDASKVVTFSTSPPLASELRATDAVHRVCGDLACMHVTGSVTAEEVSALAANVSIEAPGLERTAADGDGDGDAGAVSSERRHTLALFEGLETAFAMPVVPGTFVLPRVFDADASVVTVMIPDSAVVAAAPLSVTADAVTDAWADLQITPIVMPAGTTLRQLGLFTAQQCEGAEQRVAADGKSVVVEGPSAVLGADQHLRFHIIDTGVKQGFATFGIVRLTAPANTAARYIAFTETIAASVVFA